MLRSSSGDVLPSDPALMIEMASAQRARRVSARVSSEPAARVCDWRAGAGSKLTARERVVADLLEQELELALAGVHGRVDRFDRLRLRKGERRDVQGLSGVERDRTNQHQARSLCRDQRKETHARGDRLDAADEAALRRGRRRRRRLTLLLRLAEDARSLRGRGGRHARGSAVLLGE